MTDDDMNRTQGDPRADARDDAAEIRFSLTALGEAAVNERSSRRFLGFGPCPAGTLPSAS